MLIFSFFLLQFYCNALEGDKRTLFVLFRYVYIVVILLETDVFLAPTKYVTGQSK